MNKKIFKNILIIAILVFCLMINNDVFAAGSFNLNKTSATITEGKTATFSINGSSATGRVDITSSDTSVATVSSSSEWLENSSSTITITAKKAGTATITVTGTVADEEGAEATITKTVTVTVNAKETNTDKGTTPDKGTSTTNKDTTTDKKEETTPEQPKEKSNNALLSTLGVTPKEYDFSGFSKTKTEYSVTVPKNVDSLKVLYKTADSNAKVSVSGNSGFEVGSDNKITIKVTAEDGKTTKTYTIKVTQLAEEEEKPGNVIENGEGLYLTKLTIDPAFLSPEFSKDIYSYTATLNESNIKEVVVEAEANNKDAKIDISGHNNLVEGENTINIILTLDGTELQTVYQVIVTAHFVEDVVEQTEENETTGTNDLIGKLKNYAGIVISVVGLIVVAVIILVILLIRENKKINEDEEDYEVDDTKSEEYNVYNNDENEFANNDMQRDNFIESLYNQRNGKIENEDLTEDEKETLEEISKQTEKIFEEKVKGQSVEYTSSETEENPLEARRKRRGKGKHSL